MENEKCRTHIREYNYGCCLTEVTIKENGLCGGDSGHGGFVNIKIKDYGGTALQQNGKDVEVIDFGVSGDAERDRLIEILSFILESLIHNTKPYIEDEEDED